MLATGLLGFLLGFWGSFHCVGMCGGIVGILQNALPKEKKPSLLREVLYWAGYNGGRILSYVIAGGLAAVVGSTVLKWVDADQAHRIGQLISGLFLIAFGLYLGNWWAGLQKLERFGAGFWKKISPLTQKVIPVVHFHQSLALGVLWGWLPCGLVYSALALAFTMPSVAQGMLLMLFFGIGTLPMLILITGLSTKIVAFAKSKIIRSLLGAIVILFGVISFLGLAPGHSGHHHEAGHEVSLVYDMPRCDVSDRSSHKHNSDQ